MSKQAQQLAQRAININKSLGTKVAARYLALRDVPLEDALLLLAGRRTK